MKRVAIFTRSHVPHGGADQTVADICRTIDRYGWQTELFVAQGRRFNSPERYREVYPDLDVQPLEEGSGTRRDRVNSAIRAIRRCRPDVVLSMRLFDAYIAAAEVKRERPELRLVPSIQSYEAPYFSDLKRFKSAIDGCVTSGELVAAACRDWCGMESFRVENIPGGVVVPEVVPSKAEFQPLRLVYAGRLAQEQKRVLDFIPFVKQLKAAGCHFRLDIVGTGPEEQAVKSGLGQEVDEGLVAFHGWTDRATLYRNFYLPAHMFVHFAAWEGVTIAPREAMACGCVPIISEFTGYAVERQFIPGQTALTFPVGDVERAAGCVLQLADSPALWQELSKRARKSQQGKYSFDGAIEAWASFFDRCLEWPAVTGEITPGREKLRGRFSELGLPPAVESSVRRLLNHPVNHSDPGSEWPTDSGDCSAEDHSSIREYGRMAEVRACQELNALACN